MNVGAHLENPGEAMSLFIALIHDIGVWRVVASSRFALILGFNYAWCGKACRAMLDFSGGLSAWAPGIHLRQPTPLRQNALERVLTITSQRH
jgi:hypothetical protein